MNYMVVEQPSFPARLDMSMTLRAFRNARRPALQEVRLHGNTRSFLAVDIHRHSRPLWYVAFIMKSLIILWTRPKNSKS